MSIFALGQLCQGRPVNRYNRMVPDSGFGRFLEKKIAAPPAFSTLKEYSFLSSIHQIFEYLFCSNQQ